MLRLELTFLYLASGGGCFRWRDEDSSYLQSEHDAPSSHTASVALYLLPPIRDVFAERQGSDNFARVRLYSLRSPSRRRSRSRDTGDDSSHKS
jgi:hypothetical protein